jgi:hypothetical protein
MKKYFYVLALVVAVLLTGCKPTTVQKEVSISDTSVISDGSVYIEGNGRAFENTIGVKIFDENQDVLYSGPVVTNAQDMSKFGNFSLNAILTSFPQTDSITVECFVASAKDGSITASDSKTLVYGMPYQMVEIFFGSTKLNPEMIDCSKVFPVTRRIAKDSKNPVLDTLLLLIKGPTKTEKDNGYIESTPNNLTVNSIKETGSKIQVDFGEELMAVGGGSCKVGAIRAEITETVQGIKPGFDVVISSNGNVDEVLQP